MLSGPTTVHFYSRETWHPQGRKENYSVAELDKDVEVWAVLGAAQESSVTAACSRVSSPCPLDGQRDFWPEALSHCQHCLQGSTDSQGAVGVWVAGDHSAHTGQIWAEDRGISPCPLRQEAK